MPVITLLTDFGQRDGFAGILEGVLLGLCPDARIVSLSHEIPPQDVVTGALVLESAVPYFPEGTVHLAVVDPGVGGGRRPLLVDTGSFRLVGPDNGLLSLAAERGERVRVFHLDRPEVFLEETSATFHGRDVFAPVAARLAAGTPAEALGTEVDGLERLVLPRVVRRARRIEGAVIHVDRFGNLVTNVRPADLVAFRGEQVSVSIREMRIPGISTHYGSAPPASPVAVWNSWGRLEVAVRDGSAAARTGSGVGEPVVIRGEPDS